MGHNIRMEENATVKKVVEARRTWLERIRVGKQENHGGASKELRSMEVMSWADIIIHHIQIMKSFSNREEKEADRRRNVMTLSVSIIELP